jgi:acetyltransferase-like isoleucine patch superfamily enzyme
LGNGSIIAAGAVVSSNVEPHTMVGGVPAHRIRGLD